jgi:hypothetical protein
MNSKPLPLSFARCLFRLKNGEILNSSEIASKESLHQFCDDGILQKQPAGGRRVNYVCSEQMSLHNYLKAQYDIISLENYISEFETDSSDGESSLFASRSTKTFRGKSLQGFFIRAFHSEIVVSGVTMQPTPQGSELFINQPEKLEISESALVIGIENPECFLKFEKLAHLFHQNELIVVMRYLSNSPNKWLKTIKNSYLHFGDFDPAGLHIYIREYRNHLSASRCSFFIPADIEKLINRYGIPTLYDQQIHLLKNIDFQLYPEIERLMRLLKKHRKGLEQERLLTQI